MSNAGDSAGAPAAMASGMMNTMLEAGMGPVQRAFEELKANASLVTKMNQIVTRGGQSILSRQSSALQETLDELSSIARSDGAPKDMAAMGEVQRKYANLCMRRSIEHLRVSLDAAQELTALAFDLATERLNGALHDAEANGAGQSKPTPK